MICLLDTAGPRYFLSILADAWPAYRALGWLDSGARDRKPSVADVIMLIEWHGDKPKMPEARP